MYVQTYLDLSYREVVCCSFLGSCSLAGGFLVADCALVAVVLFFVVY